MNELIIDFRFIEILEELSALYEYFNTIEEQIKYLYEKRHGEIQEKIEKENLDEADIDIEFQEYWHKVEDIYPKSFRGSFIVNLWAFYESSITQVANFLREHKSISLKLSDIRGDFIERAQKYFKYVLKFELHPVSNNEILKNLYVLRNGFAHANGKLENMNSSTRNSIKEMINQNVGIKENTYNEIFVEKEFLTSSFNEIHILITDLIKRTRKWDDERKINSNKSNIE